MSLRQKRNSNRDLAQEEKIRRIEIELGRIRDVEDDVTALQEAAESIQESVNQAEVTITAVGTTTEMVLKPMYDHNNSFSPLGDRGFVQFPWTTPVRLDDPATVPGGTVTGCSFSNGGEYLAMSSSVTPFVLVYSRSNQELVKLANPATLPTGTGNFCAFDPSDRLLAVAHTTSPFVSIYDRSNNVLTKLANPATLPTGTGRGCAFSHNGQFLAVAHSVSPFVTIYEKTTTAGTPTFTKLTNPASLPAGTANACDWSPDNRFLVVAHGSSLAGMSIYERSAMTTFTKLSSPSTVIGTQGLCIKFSPNGKYLAIGAVSGSGTPLLIYEVSGNTFTAIDTTDYDCSDLVQVTGITWSLDSKFLTVVGTAGPRVKTFIVTPSTNTFALQTLFTGVSVADTRACAFSNDKQFLAIGRTTSPYLDVFQTTGSIPELSYIVISKLKRAGE